MGAKTPGSRSPSVQASTRRDLNKVCFFSHSLAYLHHLKEVRMPTRITRRYLFIRFACNSFKSRAPALMNVAHDSELTNIAIGNGGKRKLRDPVLGRIPKNAKTDAGGSSGGKNEGKSYSTGRRGDDGSDGEKSLSTENDEGGPRTEDEESDPVIDDAEALLAAFDAQNAALQGGK